MQLVMDTFDQTYEASPDAIARVRAEVARFASEHGMAGARVDDVRLAVSEGATNAVLHGYRGAPGTVHVTAELADGALWISIRDFGYGVEPQTLATGRTGMGLGLALIGRLVSELSVTPLPGGGTDLRMRFDLTVPPVPAPRRAMVA